MSSIICINSKISNFYFYCSIVCRFFFSTYNNFIKEVNLLGKEYRERIYREFLEIEPPTNFEDELLK